MFDRIRIIKSIHIYVSIVTFIILLLFSLYHKHLNLSEISLSKLGINKDGWIWNIGLLFISILLFFNIRINISRFISSKTINTLNYLLSINLGLTAIINMNYAIHNLVAVLYFVFTSLIIFIFGLKLHKTNFRIAQLSLFISILSAILPMISFTIFRTLGFPELVHIILLFSWLLILHNDSRVIDLIKKIGL